jgi:zinc protease
MPYAWSIRLLPTLLLVVTGCGSDAADQPPATIGLDVTRTELANGLEVVVVPNHSAPIVSAVVAFHSGAFVETEAQSGYSHLLEHMMFQGTDAVPDAREFGDRLDALGIVRNATTGRDRVNYFYTVTSNQLAPALELLASSVRTPALKPESLKKEIGAVISEFDLNDSDSLSVAWRHMLELLFDVYPNRANPLGRRDVIEHATPEDLRELHGTYYVPNNAQLIVVGDVEVNDALSLAKRWFGDWKRGADPFVAYSVPVNPALAHDAADVMTANVKASNLVVAYQGPSVRDDYRGAVAADLLARISLLSNQSFRDVVSPPTVIGARIRHSPSRHKGVISVELEIGAGFERDAIDRLQVLHDYIATITDQEIAAAKNALWAVRLQNTDANLSLALQLSEDWALSARSEHHDYLATLYDLERADIEQLLRRYVYRQPRIAVLLTDPQHALDDLAGRLERAW